MARYRLTFLQNVVYYYQEKNIPMKLFGKVALPTEGLTVSGAVLMARPISGGLSGEHIELCAEGARRKPNLSGERTEMLKPVRV